MIDLIQILLTFKIIKMKDSNYYTVYDQRGLCMGSYQDKHWAEFAKRQYKGHIVISSSRIEDAAYNDPSLGLSRRGLHDLDSSVAKRAANHQRRILMRSCVYALCCIIIVLYALVYKIVTEPFNMYVHLAFMFFGIIGCVFIYLLSHAERGDV